MPLTLTALLGIPLISEGDDLAEIILSALEATGLALEDGDILVLGQKVVSKSEGRFVRLADIKPRARARKLAERTGKDPRLVELMLRESKRVLRSRSGTIIMKHRLGFVCANAGIDHSNVARQGSPEGDSVLLLPDDSDRSAAAIRSRLESVTGRRIGVLINDSHGRAWRLGTVGVAIGMSGVPALIDQRGWIDLMGNTLHSTIVGVADELAAAASLVMGQAAEATPVVHVRGFPYPLGQGTLGDLLRPASHDLFS